METPASHTQTIAQAENDPPQQQEEKRKPRRILKHRDVNNGEKSFASGLNLYKLIWIFAIGSFLGVVYETVFVYLVEGTWLRQSGMLYGPFNQVYGFGAVLFSVLLYRFRKKNGLVIFIVSGLIGMAFEYVCSLVQQYLFGSVSWEYSDMDFNIGGRTNLMYGLGWGLMGFLFLLHVWPLLSELIERIPNFIGKSFTAKTLTLLVAAAFLFNLGLSGAAVSRQRARSQNIPPANVAEVWLDSVYSDSVMKEKYPNMIFLS